VTDRKEWKDRQRAVVPMEEGIVEDVILSLPSNKSQPFGVLDAEKSNNYFFFLSLRFVVPKTTIT
jgi:hypothetical protein